MYQNKDLDRICKDVASNIEDELSRIGVFFRIFYRAKSINSINSKIQSKGEDYYSKGKLISDIIGVRIIFYFSDDLSIVINRLKKMFNFREETVDINDETKFAPTRINLIFDLPDKVIKEFSDTIQNEKIDSTFEIQLRTILSEGWHEVDHDLRYKCQDDWNNHTDLARNFNGILATLETSEYSTLRLFDQLSYRHYKSNDIVAMLRTKYRLRFVDYTISDKVNKVFTDELIKDFFKLDRIEVLTLMFDSKMFVPLTIDNLIYIINYFFIKNEELLDITPKQLIEDLQ